MKKILVLLLGLALIFTTINIIAFQKESITTSKAEALTDHVYKHPYLLNNKELLTLLKIDSTGLRDELRKGKSLAEIASERKIDKQKVIDLLVVQATERIDKAIKDGKLTKDRGEVHKEKLEGYISRFVEYKGVFRKNVMRGSRIKEVASILGMKEEDVFSEVKSGKSIAEIAEEQGVTKKKLIEKLMEKERENITNWIEKTWKIK